MRKFMMYVVTSITRFSYAGFHHVTLKRGRTFRRLLRRKRCTQESKLTRPFRAPLRAILNILYSIVHCDCELRSDRYFPFLLSLLLLLFFVCSRFCGWVFFFFFSFGENTTIRSDVLMVSKKGRWRSKEFEAIWWIGEGENNASGRTFTD